MRGRPLPLAIVVLGCALALPAPLAAQEPAGSPEAESPAEPAEASDADPAAAEPAVEPPAGAPRNAATETPAELAPAPTRARRGATVTVSIVDFAFQPAAIRLAAGGGSVRWVNDGPQEPHTATAANGGFDTGVLAVGESAVVDFSRPGSFAYVCELHPEMKGRVTVPARERQEGGGGGGGAPGSNETTEPDGSGATPTEAQAVAAPNAAGTSRSLPATGAPARLLAGVGAGLVAAGLALGAAAAQPRRSGRCCER